MSVDWSEETPTPELVKGMITVPEVAELYGLEPNGSGKIPSFDNPEERTPSLHLYTGDGGWFDFSCGKGGDVIDFVMAAEKCTFNQALWRLWNKSLRAGREPGDVERSVPKEIVDFSEQLPVFWSAATILEWEGRLGVQIPNSVKHLDGNLLIPHADQDGVYGVKVREPGGAKSAWPGSAFTKRLYCPLAWDATHLETYCVIGEGESDCWGLNQRIPGNVYALPSGAGGWRDHWLEDLKPYDIVWLAMDNDRAGREALSKLLAKIPNSKTFVVPQLANDVREALAMFPCWDPAEQLVQ